MMSSLKTFPSVFFLMVVSFENLEDILPAWVNEDMEKSLAEAVDKYQKQEEDEGKQNMFLCRKKYLSSRSQSSLNKNKMFLYYIKKSY